MKQAIVAALALMLGACAFGDTTVELSKITTETVSKPGLIGRADPVLMRFDTVALQRPQRFPDDVTEPGDPIEDILFSYKYNGYGVQTGNLISDRPLQDLVANHVKAGLTANGHLVVDNGEQFVAKLAVKDFWANFSGGLVTVEITANTEVELVLTSATTGEEIYREAFSGFSSVRTGAVNYRTYRIQLQNALDDMVQQIILSPDLLQALQDAPEATGDKIS